MPNIIGFGTLTFSPTSTYAAGVEWSDDTPYSAQVDLRPRRSRFPALDSTRLSERTLAVTILNRSQSSAAQFWRDVFRTFAPVPATATLTATHDQTGGTIGLDVTVTNIVRNGDRAFSEMRVDCLAADPIWRDVTAGTVTVTSGTVVNSGDFPALPQIVVTPNTNWLTRRRITVIDNSGRGLANYFIRAAVPTNGSNGISAASQMVVYYKGRSIPFGVGYPTGSGGTVGGTATALDFRIDVPPNGSSYVDVYYGTVLSNTDTANRFTYGELYSASSDLSNGTIVWHDLFATTAPAGATFTWVPAKAGQSVQGVTSGLTAEGTALYSPSIGGVRLQLANNDSLPNDIDSIAVVTGVNGGLGAALTSLERRFYTNGGCRAFVRYRTADQLVWTDSWTSTTAGTFTAALDVSNAVQIVAGIEPISGTASGTLDLINGNIAGTYLALGTGGPTVTVSGTALAYMLAGTLSNTTTGDSIRFGTILMDNDVLSIDTYAQTITTAGTSPFYGDIVPSNADNWLPLAVGGNTISGSPGGGTTSYVYKRRWII